MIGDLAKKEWERVEVERALDELVDNAKMVREARRFFEDIFGHLPELAETDADTVLITHEGYKFRCYEPLEPKHRFLCWQGICPACGEETDGQDFRELWQFGKALTEGWDVAEWHVADMCGKEI